MFHVGARFGSGFTVANKPGDEFRGKETGVASAHAWNLGDGSRDSNAGQSVAEVRLLALVHDGVEPVHLRIELRPQRLRLRWRQRILAVAKGVIRMDGLELISPGQRLGRFDQSSVACS